MVLHLDGHGIVYMDMMCYSVKVPFLFVFQYYLVDTLYNARWPRRLDGLRSASTKTLALGIPVVGMLFSVWIVL